MIKNSSRTSWILFLIGLFSMAQVRLIGSIGISEIYIYFSAPFFYFQERSVLRRNGFNTLLVLLVFCFTGGIVGGIFNEASLIQYVKGLAPLYSIWASVIVLHHYLYKDIRPIRWLLVGTALTLVLNTFFFQTGTELSLYANGDEGLGAAENIMNSPIYWIGRLNALLTLPGRAWYFQVPQWYAVGAPLGLSVFSILTSESGRSAAVVSFSAAVLVFWGGKTLSGMQRLRNSVPILLILTIPMAISIKVLYKNMATSGFLGEKAQSKYEQQTKAGDDILHLLMAGRTPFFVGLTACIDKPLLGFGPLALDKGGYYRNFMYKYGAGDVEESMYWLEKRLSDRGLRYDTIPAHSHIISFWLWYGVAGLLFWCYIIRLVLDYFRRTSVAIPQLFCYITLASMSLLWNIFFSGFNNRIGESMLFVTLLLCRAVYQKRIVLPKDMVREISLHQH